MCVWQYPVFGQLPVWLMTGSITLHYPAASHNSQPIYNSLLYSPITLSLYLRMYPPLMIICSLSSTTRDDGGWLDTTPSWPEAPPQTALYAPLSSKAFSLGEREEITLSMSFYCEFSLLNVMHKNHAVPILVLQLQYSICFLLEYKLCSCSSPVWIQQWFIHTVEMANML